MNDVKQAQRAGRELSDKEALELALERQRSLLHEVDHRVKNNLQLISSLLLLQSRRLQDGEARLALASMLERVNAIATVHRRLFRTDDVEQFDFAEFLRDLVGDLAMSAGREDLQVQMDLEHIAVPAAQAAPLALLANELISNALKHPFPGGRAGLIIVGLRRDEGQVELSVRDDGVGRGEAPVNFGLTIVQLLGRQLRAHVSLDAADPGMRALVRLPVEMAA